jgi:hypothetical protein
MCDVGRQAGLLGAEDPVIPPGFHCGDDAVFGRQADFFRPLGRPVNPDPAGTVSFSPRYLLIVR